ncbi:MAG: hypothetical protein HN347_00485 [Bacteroidetes bacterium]|jgi:hypothetical protein|nr:hypothetical protein [Bacteroidota bacterium]
MLKKKLILIILNFLCLTFLLWNLTNQYAVIDSVDYESTEHAEVVIKAGILKQVGIDINLITAVVIALLIINGLLYKYWIQSKRWILEPIIILVLSFGLSLSYYLNMTSNLGNRIEKNTKHNT